MESEKNKHENNHLPNEETIKALEKSLRGEDVETHKSLKDMWKSLGIDDSKFINNKKGLWNEPNI